MSDNFVEANKVLDEFQAHWEWEEENEVHKEPFILVEEGSELEKYIAKYIAPDIEREFPVDHSEWASDYSDGEARKAINPHGEGTPFLALQPSPRPKLNTLFFPTCASQYAHMIAIFNSGDIEVGKKVTLKTNRVIVEDATFFLGVEKKTDITLYVVTKRLLTGEIVSSWAGKSSPCVCVLVDWRYFLRGKAFKFEEFRQVPGFIKASKPESEWEKYKCTIVNKGTSKKIMESELTNSFLKNIRSEYEDLYGSARIESTGNLIPLVSVDKITKSKLTSCVYPTVLVRLFWGLFNTSFFSEHDFANAITNSILFEALSKTARVKMENSKAGIEGDGLNDVQKTRYSLKTQLKSYDSGLLESVTRTAVITTDAGGEEIVEWKEEIISDIPTDGTLSEKHTSDLYSAKNIICEGTSLLLVLDFVLMLYGQRLYSGNGKIVAITTEEEEKLIEGTDIELIKEKSPRYPVVVCFPIEFDDEKYKKKYEQHKATRENIAHFSDVTDWNTVSTSANKSEAQKFIDWAYPGWLDKDKEDRTSSEVFEKFTEKLNEYLDVFRPVLHAEEIPRLPATPDGALITDDSKFTLLAVIHVRELLHKVTSFVDNSGYSENEIRRGCFLTTYSHSDEISYRVPVNGVEEEEWKPVYLQENQLFGNTVKRTVDSIPWMYWAPKYWEPVVPLIGDRPEINREDTTLNDRVYVEADIVDLESADGITESTLETASADISKSIIVYLKYVVNYANYGREIGKVAITPYTEYKARQMARRVARSIETLITHPERYTLWFGSGKHGQRVFRTLDAETRDQSLSLFLSNPICIPISNPDDAETTAVENRIDVVGECAYTCQVNTSVNTDGEKIEQIFAVQPHMAVEIPISSTRRVFVETSVTADSQSEEEDLPDSVDTENTPPTTLHKYLFAVPYQYNSAMTENVGVLCAWENEARLNGFDFGYSGTGGMSTDGLTKDEKESAWIGQQNFSTGTIGWRGLAVYGNAVPSSAGPVMNPSLDDLGPVIDETQDTEGVTSGETPNASYRIKGLKVEKPLALVISTGNDSDVTDDETQNTGNGTREHPFRNEINIRDVFPNRDFQTDNPVEELTEEEREELEKYVARATRELINDTDTVNHIPMGTLKIDTSALTKEVMNNIVAGRYIYIGENLNKSKDESEEPPATDAEGDESESGEPDEEGTSAMSDTEGADDSPATEETPDNPNDAEEETPDNPDDAEEETEEDSAKIYINCIVDIKGGRGIKVTSPEENDDKDTGENTGENNSATYKIELDKSGAVDYQGDEDYITITESPEDPENPEETPEGNTEGTPDSHNEETEGAPDSGESSDEETTESKTDKYVVKWLGMKLNTGAKTQPVYVYDEVKGENVLTVPAKTIYSRSFGLKGSSFIGIGGDDFSSLPQPLRPTSTEEPPATGENEEEEEDNNEASIDATLTSLKWKGFLVVKESENTNSGSSEDEDAGEEGDANEGVEQQADDGSGETDEEPTEEEEGEKNYEYDFSYGLIAGNGIKFPDIGESGLNAEDVGQVTVIEVDETKLSPQIRDLYENAGDGFITVTSSSKDEDDTESDEEETEPSRTVITNTTVYSFKWNGFLFKNSDGEDVFGKYIEDSDDIRTLDSSKSVSGFGDGEEESSDVVSVKLEWTGFTAEGIGTTTEGSARVKGIKKGKGIIFTADSSDSDSPLVTISVDTSDLNLDDYVTTGDISELIENYVGTDEFLNSIAMRVTQSVTSSGSTANDQLISYITGNSGFQSAVSTGIADNSNFQNTIGSALIGNADFGTVVVSGLSGNGGFVNNVGNNANLQNGLAANNQLQQGLIGGLAGNQNLHGALAGNQNLQGALAGNRNLQGGVAQGLAQDPNFISNVADKVPRLNVNGINNVTRLDVDSSDSLTAIGGNGKATIHWHPEQSNAITKPYLQKKVVTGTDAENDNVVNDIGNPSTVSLRSLFNLIEIDDSGSGGSGVSSVDVQKENPMAIQVPTGVTGWTEATEGESGAVPFVTGIECDPTTGNMKLVFAYKKIAFEYTTIFVFNGAKQYVSDVTVTGGNSESGNETSEGGGTSSGTVTLKKYAINSIIDRELVTGYPNILTSTLTKERVLINSFKSDAAACPDSMLTGDDAIDQSENVGYDPDNVPEQEPTN